MTIRGERRAQRRNQRWVDELDNEGRARLRRLLTGARFVVVPTSEAIPRVEARLAPGTVPLGVACTDGLGIDQTVAVAEVLAARGYEVTPHLASRQIRSPKHLDEILTRLARRRIGRVLVVQGRGEGAGWYPTSLALLTALQDHPKAPPGIGIGGYPEGHEQLSRDMLTASLLARARHATFVSTRLSVDPDRLLAWAAEMRVRGLELPIEAGIPGVVPAVRLRQQLPAPDRRRRRGAGWFDPTVLIAELAARPATDRLDLAGIRVETFNEVSATAAWRQQIYDFAHQARTG